MFGLITASYSVGQMFGNIGFGVASDKFGRRVIIIVCTFLNIGCSLWTAFSSSIWMLSASRFAAGVCGGTGGILMSYVAGMTTLMT